MQVSILGCGWLGLPLAQSLIQTGFSVKGSTTTPGKMALLEEKGITPFVVALSPDKTEGDITAFLQGSDILIIDIPPKLRGEDSGNFTRKLKNLIPYIDSSGITKVLFTSSTAVYADDNTVVTEATPALPETESGKGLLQAEGLLKANPGFKTTILRFGGLTGEDRQPVKYLAGKENLENPDGPVNLIHQKDCIGIILKIIAKDCWGEVFNAAAPYHPTREEHYTKQAHALGLPAPGFNHNKPSKGKTISSEKIIQELDYNFIFGANNQS